MVIVIFVGGTSVYISSVSVPAHSHSAGRNDGVIHSVPYWGNCDCGSGHTTARYAMCCYPGCNVWPQTPYMYICPNHGGSFC